MPNKNEPLTKVDALISPAFVLSPYPLNLWGEDSPP